MKIVRWALVVAFLSLSGSVAHADSFTFSLLPAGGAVSGAPGSTVGWGYTITNQSTTNWLALTSISADPFLHGTPDASIFSFPVLAPMATLALTFDPVAGAGLFQLFWDTTAPVGFVNSGTFILSGEFYDADPLAGGIFVALAPDQSALYSVTVTPSAVTPVPEPSSVLLMASGLFALRRRFRRHVPAQKKRATLVSRP